MLEIALALVQSETAGVEFSAFDAKKQAFVRVSTESVLALGARMRGISPGTATVSPAPSASMRGWPAKCRELLDSLAPTASVHIQRAVRSLRAANFEARQLLHAATSSASPAVSRAVGRSRSVDECCSTRWSPATTFCSVDPVFATEMLAHLEGRQSETRFRVMLMVHDLIPSFAPHYVTWDDDSAAIRTIQICDLLIVNSDATRRDVAAFADSHGLPVPNVLKLPMASALRDLQPLRPIQLGQAAVTEGHFVLCVGTVTIRKNQQLLLDVWEQLLAARSKADLPALIIVGRRGWLYGETMSRLERTPAFEGIVHYISDASDENIAWLYEHCAFTVFPSLYEGWGLPVSESLDFGKVCLTSDRTSLPEAGEGLAELLDPTDRGLWCERVLHYWTNLQSRTERENLILSGHNRVTARDAANAILDATTGLNV
jgi:hypothetical protein